MELKYRVHEFAKDLNLKSNEVMELLNRLEPKERTHMAVLTLGELDYLFNYYTKRDQVENFNAYFELANRPDPEGKPKKEAAAKAEEPKKEEPKKEEAKQTGPRLIAKAEPPKEAKKPAAKKAEKTAAGKAKKPAPKKAEKPAVKPPVKPAASPKKK